jgi:hypothetical protein
VLLASCCSLAHARVTLVPRVCTRVASRQGKLHSALQFLEKAAAIERKFVGTDPSIADTHLNLCAVLSHLGRYAPQRCCCAVDSMACVCVCVCVFVRAHMWMLLSLCVSVHVSVRVQTSRSARSCAGGTYPSAGAVVRVRMPSHTVPVGRSLCIRARGVRMSDSWLTFHRTWGTCWR